MLFLAATALGSGIITAVALAPVSGLAAIVATPLVASLGTVLAGALLAHRRTVAEAALVDLNGQADAMVAALKSVADHADPIRSRPAGSREAA